MSRARVFTLLLTALLSAVLTVPWASAAWAGDGSKSGDNAAEAFNEKDGKSVFDLAFEVREVSNGVVDQTNSAVAYASCENCQTVAIAIQIVLVTGMADVVTPTNIAVAVNEECSACQTLALAYQFVLGGGEPLEFTHEGRRQLKRIQREFKRLGKAGLTVDEIRARAQELSDQIRDVLTTQLVPRRDRGDDDDDDEGEDRSRGDDGRDAGDDEPVEPEPAQPPETETSPQDPAAPEAPAEEPPTPTTEEPPPPTTTEPAPEDGATPPTSP